MYKKHKRAAIKFGHNKESDICFLKCKTEICSAIVDSYFPFASFVANQNKGCQVKTHTLNLDYAFLVDFILYCYQPISSQFGL